MEKDVGKLKMSNNDFLRRLNFMEKYAASTASCSLSDPIKERFKSVRMQLKIVVMDDLFYHLSWTSIGYGLGDFSSYL